MTPCQAGGTEGWVRNRVQRPEAFVTSFPLMACHVEQWRKEDTGAQRYSFAHNPLLSEIGNAIFCSGHGEKLPTIVCDVT